MVFFILSESAYAVAAAVVARSFSCMTGGDRPTPNKVPGTSTDPSPSSSTLPAIQTRAMRDFFAEIVETAAVEQSVQVRNFVYYNQLRSELILFMHASVRSSPILKILNSNPSPIKYELVGR